MPAGSERHRHIIADLYALTTRVRKSLADALLSFIPLPADEVSRIRGWVCFATTMTLLFRRLDLASGLLFVALLLDSADGAVARRQGLNSPQTDRAMDMFTEFMLYAAYLKSYFGLVSTALMALWTIPKTVWIAHYLKPRLLPNLQLPRPPLVRLALSLAVAFQRFVFAHTLLILLAVQWAFNWSPP